MASADVRVIATGVDTSLFRPVEHATARASLGLPADRPLILFVAADGLAAKRKGGHLVADILMRLKQLMRPNEPAVLLLGTDTAPDLPLDTFVMGRLRDEARMALIYAAANVFVAPYLEDNLPNTVLEAIACGTPVVAFDIGGTADVVRHGVNGFTVPSGDVGAMAASVARLLMNGEERYTLGQKAREIACAEFDLRRQAGAYCALLQELVNARRTRL